MQSRAIPAPLPRVDDRPGFIGRRMTEAEFLAWSTEQAWAEWVDGEVIELDEGNSPEHERLNWFLLSLLTFFADDHQLGVAYGSHVMARIVPGKRWRVPDVMFYAAANPPIREGDYFTNAPDLIIEVVSPESLIRDLQAKYVEYQRAGVREYWAIVPMAKRIAAVTLDTSGEYAPMAQSEGVLRSIVLPGLWLNAEWLWQQPLPDVRTVYAEILAKPADQPTEP